MTEQEWLETIDHPWGMLEYMLELTSRPASDRKWRLYVCAICRVRWHQLTDPESREAVEVGEAYADGQHSKADLQNAQNACMAARKRYRIDDLAPWPWLASCAATTVPFSFEGVLSFCNDSAAYSKTIFTFQCHLLREIMGNPFRPVAFGPALRTTKIVGLAQEIYNNGVFDRLPALAEALEQAGCRHGELLAHCRWSWPHVRGTSASCRSSL